MFIHPDEMKDFFIPFDKMHKATVVYNTDPKKLGRVKCTIEDLFVDTSNGYKALPWVYPISPSVFGGKNTFGFFSVPQVGTELTVIFPYNDINFPFYVGYWQSSKTHPTDFDSAYPNEYGFKDPKGNIYKVNILTGVVDFTHFSGTHIHIAANGNVDIGNTIAADNWVVQADYLKAYIDNQIRAAYNAHTHDITDETGTWTSTGPSATIATPNIAAGEINSLKHRVGD